MRSSIPSTRVLLSILAQLGPSAAQDLCRRLQISQPSFSRLVRRAVAEGEDLLVAGRARATRYAARRHVVDVEDQLPVFAVDERGHLSRIAVLHAVEPRGFYVEAQAPCLDSAFYDDLPWFLDGLRPSGFLGRLIPRRHEDLDVPEDIRFWTADHTLRYLSRYGWDQPGNLVVGESAVQRFLQRSGAPVEAVPRGECEGEYPRLADGVLTEGAPGSSAAGEQPKFLATRLDGDRRVPVLVKFSPRGEDASDRRMADLLVAEHLAHRALPRLGVAAPSSRILRGAGRTFLEVERFDRVGALGRRGVVSLEALDAEFVGDLVSWSGSCRALGARRILDPGSLEAVRRAETFGRLIANTDMHGGNLLFLADGQRVGALAPLYDMLPMRYMPRHGELVDTPFEPPTPRAANLDVWPLAWRVAREFWSEVEASPEVSTEFRRLAGANERRLAELASWAEILPGG